MVACVSGDMLPVCTVNLVLFQLFLFRNNWWSLRQISLCDILGPISWTDLKWASYHFVLDLSPKTGLSLMKSCRFKKIAVIQCMCAVSFLWYVLICHFNGINLVICKYALNLSILSLARVIVDHLNLSVVGHLGHIFWLKIT